MSDDLVVNQADGVLTLTLNRTARKNALSLEMVRGIIDAVEGVAADSSCVRVIVVRTSGADFCSGIDLVESNRPERSRPRVGHLQRGFPYGAHRLVRAFDLVQVPVVAGVRGWAAGIGNALALSADVVLADTTAKFWVPMVTRGFTPDSGNTWLLPRLVGVARAKQMILRGQPVTAETAERWGLIAQCVEPDALDTAVAAVVDELRGAATVAIGLAKTLIHRNLATDFDAALQNEGIYEELAIRSDDFKEGLRAFSERRPAQFGGR